jgi:hypothetical protein
MGDILVDTSNGARYSSERRRQMINVSNDSAIVEPKVVSALETVVSRLIDSAGGQDLEPERRRNSREDRTPICRVAEGSPFRKSLLGKTPPRMRSPRMSSAVPSLSSDSSQSGAKHPTSDRNKVDSRNGLAPNPLPKLLQMALNLFWLHVASSESAKLFQDDDVLLHSWHGGIE